MGPFEDMTGKQRWLRRHPAEKAVLALGLLLIVLFAPSWREYAALFLLSAWLLLVSARVPIPSYIAFLSLPLVFLCAGASALFIGIDFSAGMLPRLSLIPEAWRTALPLVARSLASFNCLLLFALTTPLHDAMRLFRRCGIPGEVLEVGLMTYNMFSVLRRSVTDMRHSQEARLGYADLRVSYRSMGMLAGNLLHHTLARAKRMELGLAARGFDGRLTVLADFAPLSRKRLVATIGSLLVLFAATRIV